MLRISLAVVPILAFLPSACESSGPPVDSELAALGIRNARSVSPGVASAGQPDEAQFARLGDAGYAKAVCTRHPSEEGTGWEDAKASELEIEFVRIPITGPEDLTESNARALAEALATAADEKTLVYSRSGNRVGALFALKAFYLDGASVEEAVAIGRTAGMTRLEPVLRKIISP